MIEEVEPKGWEIIGNPDGNTEMTKEEFDEFKAIIDRHIAQTPPEQKKQSGVFAVMIKMYAFVNEKCNHQMLTPGHFIQQILDFHDIPQQKLANYLGLNKSNFSALMSGSRKLNFDLALKLAHIFGISAELWLQIQNKNELHRLSQANREEYEKYSLKGLLEQ